MKRYVTSAALLSLLLAIGCSDRGDKTQNVDDNQPPAVAEPAPNDAVLPQDAPAAPAPADDATERPRATPAAPRTLTTTNRPSTSAPRGDLAERPSTPAPREEWRELTVPEGTALPLELETALSSETAQVETPVRARLKQAVLVDGATVIPAGAILTGQVTEVERAGKVKGRSRLVFSFNRLQAEGMREDVRTNPLSYMGEASKGEDATKIGAGAVGGAIIGGILGGGSGAAKGAAIGGAAGTGVVLATRGKEVELASGADLAATLAAPVTIQIRIR